LLCSQAMAERSITCFDCDTPANAPAAAAYRDGFTCCNCGSRFRVLNVQGIPIRTRMTGSVIKTRNHRKTSHRPPQKLQGTTAQSSSRTYKVQVSALDDDPTGACVVDVSRADGTPITTGLGTTQPDALHGVVPYMLSEDHPQHPKPATAPDDE
jgi:hypothetical protein